jgi:CRP-like cAMP-binding protein/sugar phosphate isomerase/epimerase
MDYIKALVDENFDRINIESILDGSLREDDFFCQKSRGILTEIGIDEDVALMLLAHHKSKAKYGYAISQKNLSHIVELAKNNKDEAPLRRLINSPFFLAKACWLYEHAPYFFYYDMEESKDRDSYILEFSKQYEANFLGIRVPTDTWSKIENPFRVWITTFWERKIFDPLLLLKYAKDHNFEGIELTVDFHPFNYTKLLPEEFSHEKRNQIKEACLKSGIKIDIHSPIVGPYCPSPDPSIGKQRFFNPTECLEIQYEVIELAKDVGAKTVVFHLIDKFNLKAMVGLLEKARGSDVIVTIENYFRTKIRQNSDEFIAYMNEIMNSLPDEIIKKNFGITFDVGHVNIEGEDPIVAADKIGNWCLKNSVYLRLHATDNYGNLLHNPPAHSADVHSNVSGRGINNEMIIKLLRSMGHQFDVVAEQIQPLSTQDVACIHEAQTCDIDKSYEHFVEKGSEKLSTVEFGSLIDSGIVNERAYLFLAGMKDISYLKEYLVYRKIQDKKNLTSDEAKKISKSFMKMPQKLKKNITTYFDDLLLPVQSETGVIQKSDEDLMFQNISGALFATISDGHLNQIFSKDKIYTKGEVICEENEPGYEMYFIKEGEVTVHVRGHVASLGPGEIFGEIGLFYNTVRTATIKAASDKTKLGVLTRRGLENLFKGCHSYAYDLVYRLYNILPDRLRNMDEKYRSAIRNLQLIFEGEELDLPNIEHMQIRDKGEKAHFFPTLSHDEVKKIFREVKIFNTDQYIFSEGDQGDGAYYILDGKVKVVVSPSISGEIILSELGVGDIFGEMALIDERPRSASVVTKTPCKLGFINKVLFNEFIEKRTDLSFRLMNFICLSLFSHILRLNELYSNIKKE